MPTIRFPGEVFGRKKINIHYGKSVMSCGQLEKNSTMPIIN